MTQHTLGGGPMNATEAGEVFPGDTKCGQRDGEGVRCVRYAIIGVDFGGGWIPMCSYHARDTWLDAAGVE